MFARPLNGQNHLFTFSTHLLPCLPSFQRENIRKFGHSDVVPKPVSMSKVYYAAGNGVQPLVPVFRLSFLSGNPDFKGRKTPNDPCTCHCKNGGCLRKGCYLMCMASFLHLFLCCTCYKWWQLLEDWLYGMHTEKWSVSFLDPLSVVLTQQNFPCLVTWPD